MLVPFLDNVRLFSLYSSPPQTINVYPADNLLIPCLIVLNAFFSDLPSLESLPQGETYNNFSVTVRDVILYSGASFITVLLGNIMTMPGLSRKPNYENIDVVDNEIVNLN